MRHIIATILIAISLIIGNGAQGFAIEETPAPTATEITAL